MLEIAIILGLIAATVAVAAFFLAPRLPQKVVYATEPDRPKAFGYRMAWLALRTRDTERVIARLGLTETFAANWNNGIGTVYAEDGDDATVFVSPPVNSWTFVVGLALPQPLGRAFVDTSMPFLLDLGSEFIGVQYYIAYPDLDAFAWVRVINGQLDRAYAINDEGVIWNKGRPSKEEKALGTKLYEMRGVRRKVGDAAGEPDLHPTEQHVMKLAAQWSLDPTELEKLVALPGLGTLGKAPPHWRPRRLRRTG